MRILITVLLMSINVFALEVSTLNQGACWVNESDGVSLKVASFNDATSYQVQREYLDSVVNFLHENNLSPTDIESIKSYVHCSGLGVRFVFNIAVAKRNYCLWASFKDNQFVIKNLDYTESDGMCDGVVTNKLVVATKDIKSLINYIESIGYDVNEYENIFGNDLFSLTFEDREIDIFKVRKVLLDSKIARIVDLSTRQRPIGDSIEVEYLNYKK